MYVASLLTNPETPTLDRAAVEALRNAWGGGDAVWLDPGVAAEFALAEMPANLWEVWQGFQAMGVDLVVQRAEGRKKRAEAEQAAEQAAEKAARERAAEQLAERLEASVKPVAFVRGGVPPERASRSRVQRPRFGELQLVATHS